MLLEGKSQKAVASVGPGAFATVAKLKETVTGDTLATEAKPILLPALLPSHTMVTFAIEAQKQGEEDKVFSSFSKLIEEDPSLAITPATPKPRKSGLRGGRCTSKPPPKR